MSLKYCTKVSIKSQKSHFIEPNNYNDNNQISFYVAQCRVVQGHVYL